MLQCAAPDAALARWRPVHLAACLTRARTRRGVARPLWQARDEASAEPRTLRSWLRLAQHLCPQEPEKSAAKMSGPACGAEALIQAILSGDLAAADEVLDHIVDSSTGSRPVLSAHGLTALHAAALANCPAAVAPLLEVDPGLLEEAVSRDRLTTASRLQTALGLTARQAAVAAKRWGLVGGAPVVGTPIELAVAMGAVKVAEQLAAAGAATGGALALLLSPQDPAGLSRGEDWQAADRLAGPLLQRGLPDGADPVWLHQQALVLAMDAVPARPGMLRALLRLHQDGGVPAGHAACAEAVAEVCRGIHQRLQLKVVTWAYRYLDPTRERRQSQIGKAELVHWLLQPGGEEALEPHHLARLLEEEVQQGRNSVAAALLKVGGMRGALQQGAMLYSGRHQTAGEKCLMTAIEAWLRDISPQRKPERAEFVALLATGGATVSLGLITELLGFAGSGGSQVECGYVEHDSRVKLRALLTLVKPLPRPPTEASSLNECPVYRLLQLQRPRHEGALQSAYWKPPLRASDAWLRHRQLHMQQLRLMELLAAAGYRPTMYTLFRDRLWDGSTYLRANYYPAEFHKGTWELERGNRWLWRAALQEPWSPTSHRRFPPTFQAAARTLLLVAHRGAAALAAGEGGGTARRKRAPHASRVDARMAPAGAVGLSRLPQELMWAVLQLAAYPLSAWQPDPDGGWLWDALQARYPLGQQVDGPSWDVHGPCPCGCCF